MALPQYFERPRAPYSVFQWNGSNIDDVRAWYDAQYAAHFARPTDGSDGTLSVPVDGGSLTLQVGDKMILGPSWYDTCGPVTDDEIAARLSPLDQRP